MSGTADLRGLLREMVHFAVGGCRIGGVSIAPSGDMELSDDSAPFTDREEQLENEFIAQYLRSRDCDEARLRELPEQERHRLLQEASAYASARLVQVEATRHVAPESGRGE